MILCDFLQFSTIFYDFLGFSEISYASERQLTRLLIKIWACLRRGGSGQTQTLGKQLCVNRPGYQLGVWMRKGEGGGLQGLT